MTTKTSKRVYPGVRRFRFSQLPVTLKIPKRLTIVKLSSAIASITCVALLASIVYNLFALYPRTPDAVNIVVKPFFRPVANATDISLPGDLSAKSFIVKDPASGTVLAALNEHEKLLPASLTKIMTALVVLDNYNLSDVVEVHSLAGSNLRPGLNQGEKLTVENLLYSMLVDSNNDAADALADYYPSGRADFVLLMNQKAASLELTDSRFANPVGFDDPDQYSSAWDLAILGARAMNNPIFARIVSTKASEIYSADQTYQHDLQNVNELLGEIPGIRGIKTGYTEEAGQNLVTDVVRDNHEIISVVMGSSDRFKDTKELINWAYANFTWQETPLQPATQPGSTAGT